MSKFKNPKIWGAVLGVLIIVALGVLLFQNRGQLLVGSTPLSEEVALALETPAGQLPQTVASQSRIRFFWDIYGVLPQDFSKDIDAIVIALSYLLFPFLWRS